MDIDPTCTWTDSDYHPIDSWRKSVAWRARSLTLSSFMKARVGSTINLMRRAVEKDATQMPRFPITKRANWGPDQIRLRLLTGTSALNGTLAKYSKREVACPFDSYAGQEEDTLHFLLHCKELESLRTTFREQLHDCCTCDRRGSDGVPGCAEFYEGLDDAGKALFMLGGPVDGRTPEDGIDACAREFVRKAWEHRSTTLNAQAEDPLVVDVTKKGASQGRRPAGGGRHQEGSVTKKGASQGGPTITDFFHKTQTQTQTQITLNTNTNTNTNHVKHKHNSRTLNRNAQSTSGSTGSRTNGSGIYDSTHVMICH